MASFEEGRLRRKPVAATSQQDSQPAASPYAPPSHDAAQQTWYQTHRQVAGTGKEQINAHASLIPSHPAQNGNGAGGGHLGRAWQPGVLRQFPFFGLATLVLSVCCE
jgi:hypothetical protein